MAERQGPKVYSIAAHRGFADALVAGLVPRYSEPEFGLARLTLLLPSSRARRTVSEAFIRHAGEQGNPGLLMPRMAVVGDLDLDLRVHASKVVHDRVDVELARPQYHVLDRTIKRRKMLLPQKIKL